MLDIEEDETLFNKGYAREIVKLVQTARKDKGLDIDDEIAIFIELGNTENSRLANIVKDNLDTMRSNIRMRVYLHPAPKGVVTVFDGEYVFNQEVAKVTIIPDTLFFDEGKFAEVAADEKARDSLRQLLNSHKVSALREKVAKGANFKVKLDEKEYELTRGTHFFLDEADLN